MNTSIDGKTAFVTGATGLLGGNLVRALVQRRVRVKALARSPEKARIQFQGLEGVTIVSGDMLDVAGFAHAFAGCDLLFHAAAYFRDSYGGGDHRRALNAVNVDGTRSLFEAAYAAGVRRMVAVSSIAVLDGAPGALIDETSLRRRDHADDYYRSKIDAEAAIFDALDTRPDAQVAFVLPGWMHGPGDMGPTSAGQVTLDFLAGRIPGVTPGSVSLVDARDVAQALIAAAERGRRGERYLAAGRHMTMTEVFAAYARVTGLAAPKAKLPAPVLLAVAAASEAKAKFTKKPVLLSLATVKLMLREADRTHFDHSKSQRELGVRFRPVEETLADEIAWYREHDWPEPARRTA